MAKLLYKTRGETTPQGKPRVYFACHPEDRKGCFEPVVKDILEISNCAVYYYEDEPELDEEYYLNLGQMQLIVMPVTSRLMYLPSRAMDVEFPYAVEHHIPVLPLMQESGLEQRFNEKCGDLQFLDKYNTDSTAIPYDEKLKKYLKAVLVGDELAAKIRAAFDAYVFLSYRKKDRKYAQELMRLIHRNPLCRDIAIWYDEFLTPGENFNDSIKAALEKSGLFVLAVTPNLVNEINYIMTTEYPMAKEAGKPIVPAQMQPTDWEALRTNYDGIPDCVDPQNASVLTEAFVTALRNLALRENDTDPQHNFFIGLAYLSGIDVEVDHDCAVKLITSAAESGLTEAMEKLVSMYETGEGVKRNYETAISWREKLTEQARLEYIQNETEVSALRYYIRLYDLGQAWFELADFTAARKAYETMCCLAQKRAEATSSIVDIYYLSASYMELGDICVEEREYAAARQWYERSLEQQKKLDEMGVSNAQRGISLRYEKLGIVCELELDPYTSEQWYSKALEISQILAQSGSADDLRRLSYAYSRMGDSASYARSSTERGVDTKRAYDWYSKALDIRLRLAEDGTLDSQQSLLHCYCDLGRICLLGESCLTYELAFTGKSMAEALQWYTKALEIGEKLAESDKTSDLGNLAHIYTKLSRVYAHMEDQEKEKEMDARALEITERWARTGTIDALESLALKYSSKGTLCERGGDLPEAKVWAMKAVQTQEKILVMGTEKAQVRLAWYYRDMGRICQAQGDLAEAKSWFEKLLEIRRKMAEKGALREWIDLADCYNSLGSVCKAEGKQSDAGRWFFIARRAKGIAFSKEGNLCYAAGDLPEAKKWHLKALEVREKLAGTGSLKVCRDLSASYIALGDIFRDEGDRETAIQWYTKSQELAQKQLEKQDAPEIRDDLAFAYARLGRLLEDVQTLEKAWELWNALAKERPDVSRYGKNARIIKSKMTQIRTENNE